MLTASLSTLAEDLGGQWQGDDVTVTGVAIDSRRLVPGMLFIALQDQRDGHDFIGAAREKGAAAALVERFLDDPLPQLKVTNCRRGLTELAINHRARFAGKVVAITGSNGKTTVKEMTAALLRQQGRVLATKGNLNNDLGVPLTLLCLSDEAFAVIEMGANHYGEIADLTAIAGPDVAVVNNAGPAHLEGFGSIAGVARAKGEIFQGLTDQGTAVFNADDRYAHVWRELNPARRVIDFSLDGQGRLNGAVVDADRNRLRISYQGESITVDLPLTGIHNYRNALAASSVAVALGLTWQQIAAGLEQVRHVGGRLQPVAGNFGGHLIDDSYNANPASLLAALETLQKQHYWLVVGDMAELGDSADQRHADIGLKARELGYSRLYAVGEHSRQMVRTFGLGARHFDGVDSLIAALDEDLQTMKEKPNVLVKGSRSMRMERVVEHLKVGER